MNKKLAKLETLKGQIRGRLADYIARFKEMKPGKNFCCINPAHDDKDPSCGIIPGNQELFHCFGCGAVGDIFVAANMLEGKPLRGTGFLVENLFYLAKLYGHEVPDFELTEDEQHDMDTYRAYATASQLLVKSKHSDRVSAKLQCYGWSPRTLADLGIGSVTSFEDYLERMTKTYGYDRQFLKNVDLDNKRIFNPEMLVFTVSDEHGQPVGFAARNLLFDGLKSDCESAINEYGEDSEQAKAAKAKMPAKFVNSTQQNGETELKNRIYQKSKRLFTFHLARKNAPPLYVFEGYGDAATAYNAGLHNACAIGSISFSEEHLNLVLDSGIEHVIFVLDADEAGDKGTERFVKLVEEHLGNHAGLKVQIICMPAGTDDPDAMIRYQGLDKFLSLEKVDVFAWRLQQAVANGEHPDHVFERTVGLITNELHNLKQLRMAEALSKATRIPQDVIWAEVVRLKDLDGQKYKAEVSLLATRTARQLERNPEGVAEILQASQKDIERIRKMRDGYDLKTLQGYIDEILQEAEAHVSEQELLTGWPLFDKNFGGIPRSDAFISIPGKPNQGKSSFLANVSARLVDHNDDVIVLYHTVDDAMRWFLLWLFGSRYRVASEYFYKAGYYLAQNPLVKVNGVEKRPFKDIYSEAKKWLKTMMGAERLLIYDASVLDQSVFSLEMRVRDLRKKYPSRPIVVFGDNFHLYTNPAMKEEGEAKIRGLSMACKNLANVHHITLIMTMELPKNALEAGKRPRLINIKGSAGISYDASANIGVYNDQKDLREKAELTWEEDVEPTEEVPGEVVTRLRRPVLEMVFDKSKVNSGFDGNIYYYFHPPSGQITECDVLEQEKYRKKAARQQEMQSHSAPKGANFGYEVMPYQSHSAQAAAAMEAQGAISDSDAVNPYM